MTKIDARSAPTGRLEMAALSSGVRPPKGSNFVMIFNLGSNSRGEAATPSTVSPHNAHFSAAAQSTCATSGAALRPKGLRSLPPSARE